MANVQVGKYKRPGIFIEEFDRSINISPVNEGLNNLLIGVSRKGPVNRPIRLTSIQDLESIFGLTDRNLERRGSYFHKTVSKLLETSPVYAMNLLLTDDELDKIEYKSLSTSSDKFNDVKKEGPYRRFFDTTGFWTKDEESFLNLSKENNINSDDTILNFTNMSDRYISVFIFKSSATGFDRSLDEWYGSTQNVPEYLNGKDFASDYIVDVLIVGGDWSNYQALSVDSKWGEYFTPSGLDKNQVINFANNRNVTRLSYYEGLSLIPYFKDSGGDNIFIENIINNDTERTGLFCSFNKDAVEDYFYNGKIDLIGNNLVGSISEEIEFLSYKESISENVDVKIQPLDLPGNVYGMLGDSVTHSYEDTQAYHAFANDVDSIPKTTGFLENTERTAWFKEGAVYDVSAPGITSSNIGTASTSITYNVGSDNFVIIGDNKLEIDEGDYTFDINYDDYPSTGTTSSYTSVFYINTNGEIDVRHSFNVNENPSIDSSDVVLGYVDITIGLQSIDNITLNDVSVDDGGFKDLELNSDYNITVDNGDVTIEFENTNTTPDSTNYEQYRRFKMFNSLVSLLDDINKERVVMNLSSGGKKISLENIDVDINDEVYDNKSITLKTGLSDTDLVDVENGYIVFYREDNEFIPGSENTKTKEGVASDEEGVVGKYSEFYTKYYNGDINSKDYFYTNRLYTNNSDTSNNLQGDTVEIEFVTGEGVLGEAADRAGYDYVVFKKSDFDTEVGLEIGDKIIIPDSSDANKNDEGYITLQNDAVGGENPFVLAGILGFSGYFAYQIDVNVEPEILTDVDAIYDYDDKNYLRMYLTNEGELNIKYYAEKEFITEKEITPYADIEYTILSERSNHKQSVDIETPSGYEQNPNKIVINASRYSEIRRGDFLEAYYDENELEEGEVPRKLTRILSKKQYPGDSNLIEITCDSRIKIYEYAGNLQAMRYQPLDDYATTYKAISLRGFRLRQDSLPDGTEERQNDILDIVGKGTNLYKALTNKDAIDFRYLIDSFGLGLIQNSKQQLVDIAGGRLDCFAFINMPSMKSFKSSKSPSFVDDEGVLKTEYMAQGGNLERNPATLYTLATGEGDTCAGYFGPYLTINDNGRRSNVPPSAYVATTYLRKHISNITSITPWTIAAGVTNGRIFDIIDVEQDFAPEDIENLNQAKMNPIVFKRNRGHVIETENTALTEYESALSFIHVREVLIELERDISDMLLEYQWHYNTPDVRAEIKLRADTICENYVNKNGLYNFFNKIDEENNTDEIIDKQMGILDTYVEPIKGMGIIVNNITILNTGAISAGGFISS